MTSDEVAYFACFGCFLAQNLLLTFFFFLVKLWYNERFGGDDLLYIEGMIIGVEQRTRQDGTLMYVFGVACGVQSYQVFCRANELPACVDVGSYTFGTPVRFAVRCYSGRNGLYVTGVPVVA